MVRRLIKIMGLVVLLFMAGTFGYWILFSPKASFIDCLYMTAITVSTVGYREMFNVDAEPLSKLFTIGLIVGGMGVMAYAVSSVTALVVEGQLTDMFRRRRMDRQIAGLKGH